MYEWVKKYIGIPFISNGRTIEGCDCYGLIRMILKNEYNTNLPEFSNNYNDALNVKETAKLFEEHRPVLAAEKIEKPEEGAVVLITEHGVPAHVGIVAGDGYILHTGIKTGSVCQRDTHPALSGRIEGYYNVS
ncbi:MAG: NlpC/P60 family protein [Treponema sp.]|nr:NlpC/P60 family protein [Treponema sp.]